MLLADLRETIADLRWLREEAEAVIAHFENAPTPTAENVTEEDARWIMRYDAVCAAYRKLGWV